MGFAHLLGMGVPEPCDALKHLCILEVAEQLWTLTSSGLWSSPNLPFQKSLSRGTVQPSLELEQKLRAFLLALIQQDSVTPLLPSPGTGLPTFTKHVLLQLLGFVKLKSMFAKSLQLLGETWYHTANSTSLTERVCHLLQGRAREHLWEQHH